MPLMPGATGPSGLDLLAALRRFINQRTRHPTPVLSWLASLPGGGSLERTIRCMTEETPQGHERPEPGEGAQSSGEIVARSQVVLDGELTREKLLTLIDLGREEEALDYKRSYDLTGRSTKDRVEMVRDVVAMANTSGGYIVLGVDERRTGGTLAYEPVGISEDHLGGLDIDRLKPQVERYLNVPVPIRLQVHHLEEYGGYCFALVYVEESPEGTIVMEKDGQYQDGNGRSETVFRAGDVLVRDGGSSRRADQNAMREQVSKMRRRERERWTEEILGVRELTGRLDRLIEALGGGATGPSRREDTRRHGAAITQDEKSYYLGASAFEGVVLEALRADDDIGLMWYVNNAASAFYRGVEEAAESENVGEANRIRDNRLEPLLDSLAVLAITCARYRRPRFLRDVRGSLYAIYEGAHTTDFDRPSLRVELRQSWVWEAVIKRVYAIGAALLSLNLHEEVPTFIRQPVLWDDYWYERFWARHALTMRARDRGLTRQGLCALTADFVEKREWIYQVFRGNEDNVVSALCQFDFLQCIHVNHEADDERAAYPSFGIYHNARTEPVLAEILRDDRVREALLPQMPDDRLVMIVKLLDQMAGREFVAFNAWATDYWHDPAIRTFLKRFPDPVP